MKISRSPSTGVSSDGPSFPPGGVMIGGALPSLLLDFQPRPKTPRRNWRNVLHQQRLEATLHQHRDANEQDDLGQEEAADFTPLTPHYTLVSSSTCNLTISSMLFSPPPLPWPRYDKGPNDLTPISRPWQPNSIRTKPFDVHDSLSLETTFECSPGPGSGMLQCRPSKAAVHGIADDSFSLETTFACTPEPWSGMLQCRPPKAVHGIAKRSHITIKNGDELCCARAIVTMKALADANGDTGNRD